MNIYEALNSCLSNMKASDDFNDETTVNSIKDLLSCVIENPAELINFANEEKLSIALTSVLTSQFPTDYPKYKDINVRNLVFATAPDFVNDSPSITALPDRPGRTEAGWLSAGLKGIGSWCILHGSVAS